MSIIKLAINNPNYLMKSSLTLLSFAEFIYVAEMINLNFFQESQRFR